MKRTATEILRSAFGLPCWQVRWDGNVGLDMNFGAPRLEVREPSVSNAKSPRVRSIFARRGVHLRGTHWLCISPGRWRLELRDGTVVRDSSSVKRLNGAVARFKGEKFEGVSVDTQTGSTVLYFDLGARIYVRARSGDSLGYDLWSLSNPTSVIQIFSGGRYSSGSVYRSLDVRHALTVDDEEQLVITRTAKLARSLREELRSVAV